MSTTSPKKKKKSDSEKEGAEGKKAASSSDDKEKRDKEADVSFQFGWINIVLIFGIGAIFCIKLGLFDGDNVPDFVAKRDDLQYYFKTLAAPEMPANDSEKEGGDGEPERDPFAAPEEDGNTRF